jgi:hypothetical protein
MSVSFRLGHVKDVSSGLDTLCQVRTYYAMLVHVMKV